MYLFDDDDVDDDDVVVDDDDDDVEISHTAFEFKINS